MEGKMNGGQNVGGQNVWWAKCIEGKMLEGKMYGGQNESGQKVGESYDQLRHSKVYHVNFFVFSGIGFAMS